MNKPKKLVVLTGAGISAESGIKTFRDSGGLWEGHNVMQVASPQGWEANRSLVLEFYNQRRKQARECQPNQAHLILARLESSFDITVITQNVDDLHEKAGSSKVIHLHGELNKAQSTLDPKLVYELDHWEIKEGDLCEKGSQLRPHIVWFGEEVPKMEEAIEITREADIFLVIGTSLQVYPAAGLMHYAPKNARLILIDPQSPTGHLPKKVNFIQEKATVGMRIIERSLIDEI
ncbi:NAD-dependent deacylase [Algoriphagus sp. CAU 1675]|uniref:SIR2 family NAD-dependent protein deacylase n=1 Tax=Algoriphagus sp. CAU 1675 TaxID=3032597 RepID=UPI0023DCCDF2|nr:NAD-dependent deacylase [Algoriphagus sp. CAU 1675]MDF2158273.1 NAD-dependent deacylase [Algoriphagus sp. CAU 1675]